MGLDIIEYAGEGAAPYVDQAICGEHGWELGVVKTEVGCRWAVAGGVVK